MRSIPLLLLVGCGFQLAPGSAIDDAPRDSDGLIDSSVDAPTDGSTIDGMVDAMIDAPINPAAFCDAQDPNLRACYRFENNLQDGSSYANTGVATSTSYQNGHIGQALNAQGSTVSVPNAPSLSLLQMTLKMWIRPAAHPTGLNRMGLVENDSFRMFTLSNGRIRCAINAGGVEVITTAGVPLNTFSRVTCTYDLLTMRVYIDGVERGTTIAVATIAPATTEMTIGRQQPSGETFNGMIDDLQIFNAIVAP